MSAIARTSAPNDIGTSIVERHLALDAVAAGLPSSLVLISGQLVCTGTVELPAVLDALSDVRV